jgi:hypothetical protein
MMPTTTLRSPATPTGRVRFPHAVRVVTVVAFTRIRQRVAVLEARAEGASVIARESRWHRLIKSLAPDPVMINSFPRMNLITKFTD